MAILIAILIPLFIIALLFMLSSGKRSHDADEIMNAYFFEHPIDKR